MHRASGRHEKVSTSAKRCILIIINTMITKVGFIIFQHLINQDINFSLKFNVYINFETTSFETYFNI
jgi:hypothetical protein